MGMLRAISVHLYCKTVANTSLAGKLYCDITTTQVNSALHHSAVEKSSTTFGWGKGGKVTAAGLQVTLCDPVWHVISCSSEVISTNCYILSMLHSTV